MKSYLLTFLFIATFSFCRAQDSLKMALPQLLESAKIDSLISAIIKSPENQKVAKNDSCLLLMLSKNETHSYLQGIKAVKNKETIFSAGHSQNQKNIGFFEYNGYVVFVYGDEILDRFFANTDQTKEFTFINPSTQQAIFILSNYLSLNLAYENGTLKISHRVF